MRAVAGVFALDVVAKVILAVTGILLIRVMPSDEYAKYTFAIAVVALSTDALVSSWRTIYVAGGRSFTGAVDMGVFLTAQILILGGALVITLPLRDAAKGLYWGIAAVVLGRALVELARGVFQRDLKFGKYASIEIARAALLCFSVWAIASAVSQGFGAWAALTLEALGLLGFGSYLLLRQRARVGVGQIRPAVRLLRHFVTGNYKYLGSYLVLLAFFGQLDIFMLTLLGSNTDLATFGSSLRYYAVLSMGLAAVHTVLLPVVQHIRTVDDLDNLLSSHKRLVILFAGMAVVAIGVAGWAIPLIDQGRYPDAVLTFRILAVSSIISFAFSPYVNLLIRFDDFKFMLGLLTIAVVVDVMLNAALIPRAGSIGAALASSVATGLVTTTIFVRTHRFRKAMRSTMTDTCSGDSGPSLSAVVLN